MRQSNLVYPVDPDQDSQPQNMVYPVNPDQDSSVSPLQSAMTNALSFGLPQSSSNLGENLKTMAAGALHGITNQFAQLASAPGIQSLIFNPAMQAMGETPQAYKSSLQNIPYGQYLGADRSIGGQELEKASQYLPMALQMGVGGPSAIGNLLSESSLGKGIESMAKNAPEMSEMQAELQPLQQGMQNANQEANQAQQLADFHANTLRTNAPILYNSDKSRVLSGSPSFGGPNGLIQKMYQATTDASDKNFEPMQRHGDRIASFLTGEIDPAINPTKDLQTQNGIIPLKNLQWHKANNTPTWQQLLPNVMQNEGKNSGSLAENFLNQVGKTGTEDASRLAPKQANNFLKNPTINNMESLDKELSYQSAYADNYADRVAARTLRDHIRNNGIDAGIRELSPSDADQIQQAKGFWQRNVLPYRQNNTIWSAANGLNPKMDESDLLNAINKSASIPQDHGIDPVTGGLFGKLPRGHALLSLKPDLERLASYNGTPGMREITAGVSNTDNAGLLSEIQKALRNPNLDHPLTADHPLSGLASPFINQQMNYADRSSLAKIYQDAIKQKTKEINARPQAQPEETQPTSNLNKLINNVLSHNIGKYLGHTARLLHGYFSNGL